MKKVFLILVSSAIALSSFAQAGSIHVGGTLSFSRTGGSNSTGSVSVDKESSYSFAVCPEGHYYLNDKLAVGAGVGLVLAGTTDPTGGTNNKELKNSSSTFYIEPYARYDAIEISNLTLFGKGYIDLGFGGSSVKNGSTTTDGPSSFDFNFGIQPGISYKLTEKFEIEALLGGLIFEHNRLKYDQTNLNGSSTEIKSTTNKFSLGISTGLSFGLIYKL